MAMPASLFCKRCEQLISRGEHRVIDLGRIGTNASTYRSGTSGHDGWQSTILVRVREGSTGRQEGKPNRDIYIQIEGTGGRVDIN